MQTTTRKRNRHKQSRPTITEAKLRRIIRDELSRQILVQEGFLEAIKQPFKKLGDKAKKWVLEKSSELASKIKEALVSLQVPEDMKEFVASIPNQEGGVALDELVKMIPGLAEGKSNLDKMKEIDFKELFEDSIKNESFTLANARMEYILSEEKYTQNIERLSGLLKESVALGAISTWYTFSKTVITTLSLVIFVTEGAEKVTKLLGLEKASKIFKKIAHFLEKIEEWFVSKAIFPAPVQYAAYLTLSGAKKLAGKSGGEKILTFKEFQSPENKETKEKVIKGLKIALLCVIVVEALSHLVHAMQGFFSDMLKSAKEMLHAGEHAGIEGRSVAKTAGEIGKTAGEFRTGASGLAGGAAAASQV